MTHTAHRLGSKESLACDYVVLVISARGFNEKGCTPRLQRALEILNRHNPANLGEVKTGSIYRDNSSFDKIRGKITDTSVIHAVYTDLDHLKEVIRELKEADLGLSVVVSGVFRDVFCAAKEVGLKPHTVGISLGVMGNTDLLPSDDVLAITTMCGHGMVSPALVRKLVDDIRAGAITPEAAGRELARACVCGIFNPVRAAKLLAVMADIAAT